MKRSVLFLSLVAVAIASSLQDPNPAYVCSFCILVAGLAEQIGLQIRLEEYLSSQCSNQTCKNAVHNFILLLEKQLVPEEICREAMLCQDECVVFTEWPVNPLPPQPPEWPVERRYLRNALYSEVREIFSKWIENTVVPEHTPFMGKISAYLGRATGGYADSDCAHNVTCKLIAFVDGHKPLQDHDGDSFATKEAEKLRGSDWRGYDCDDKVEDIYPGRKETSYGADVDHNCNGIFGGNSTGSYEDMFCSEVPQRGIAILGDSATAHFHIPPQWLTAQGWNGLEQLIPDAMNELDVPMCSWGTGHVELEKCPYQHPVPGADPVSATSIYTLLRERNRCNANDFQNIGVNGARITSSMGLVDSLARNPSTDHQLLVYLALIGNDVCNGHPGYDHMTTPESFYEHAMESLTALDSIVPKGSHVVAVALFDGEFLYNTMHALQHPVGTTYKALYDFMNCEEENPCWGWLNSDPIVRANTTKISNSLNDVYQDIMDNQKFTNFDFIFYNPHWASLFSEYASAGYPLSNLIEPVDGFHPSQAGNALFAQKFYEFLENEYPEALGPVNPHNAEIDKLFYSAK